MNWSDVIPKIAVKGIVTYDEIQRVKVYDVFFFLLLNSILLMGYFESQL